MEGGWGLGDGGYLLSTEKYSCTYMYFLLLAVLGTAGIGAPLVGTTGVLLTALCSAQRDDLCGHLFAFGRRRKSTTTRDVGIDTASTYSGEAL